MSLSSAIAISLLLILLSGIFIALATYFYASTVQKKNEGNNETVIKGKKSSIKTSFSAEPKVSIEPRTLIEAQEVQSDGVLATSSTVIGVISLEIFVRRNKPDYIVGVNRGGWLISTYLAHRLNIHRDKLLRFDADKSEVLDKIDALKKAIISDPEMDILLIDDISRTGSSIRKATSYMRKTFPLAELSAAVLVVCGRETDKNIDYNPYWTQYKDVQLPWSSDDRKREARKIINAQGKVVRLGDQDSLELKMPVLRIADSETKEGEGVDISNDDVEAVIHLLEHFIDIPAAV